MAHLVVHFVHFPRSCPHDAFAKQHGCALFFGEGRFFVVLVLLHAIPPDGFCSVLLCRPHLPHGARPVCWLFNLCVDLASLVGFQQPLPRCRLSATRSLCRLRRQHSLRGRFAPTALGSSSSVIGQTEPVLGQSNSAVGQAGTVLGYSVTVNGQAEVNFGVSAFANGKSDLTSCPLSYCFALIRIKVLSGGKLVSGRLNDW